jgi:hypothetical protein
LWEKVAMIEQYYRPPSMGDGEGSTGLGEVKCPQCHRGDATAKVSAIARANRGRFELEDGSTAVYESELGALLSQPPRPEGLPLSVVLVAFIVGWLLLALDLVVVALLRSQDEVTIPEAAFSTATWVGIAWFGCLIPGIAVLRYLYLHHRARRAMPAWREQARRWQTFYYCTRSDVVFIRGEDYGVAPEHIEVLYRQGRIQPQPASDGQVVPA